MSEAAEPGDDGTIAAADILLRRIFHAGLENQVSYIVIDPVTHARVPSSAGFVPDEDGLSLYLERILIEGGLAADAVASSPANAVAALSAASVRAHGLAIRRDPHPDDVPDPEHPRHAAHCLATGWEGLSRRAALRVRRGLAAASTLVVDPGANHSTRAPSTDTR